MNMDPTSAGMLLSVAQKFGADAAVDASKLFGNEQPSETAIAVAEAKKLYAIDDRVAFLYMDGRMGTVVGFNEATTGFYPGYRYPIIVKVDGSCFDDGKARTFEYGTDDIRKA